MCRIADGYSWGFQGRQGANDNQEELLPRSMRLDVLKFLGFDPDSWIFAITEYFSLFNTHVDQWLRIVGFNLEGGGRNGFGGYPQGALWKLLQLGTVKDYQREFEKLMNRFTDIPESLLISFYISGLKLHLQRELMVLRPTTLGDAFALAWITEARLEGQAAALTGTTTKPVATVTPQRQSVLRLGGCSGTTNTTKPLSLTLLELPNHLKLNGPRRLNNKNDSTKGCVLIVIIGGHAGKSVHKVYKARKRLPYVKRNKAISLENVTSKVGIEVHQLSLKNCTWDQQVYSLVTTYSLKGDDSLRIKKISLHQMQVMLKHDDVYGVYEIHYLSIETEVKEMSPRIRVPRLLELEYLLL
nr:hypothetical protein [Tanacetum cinerariifolium]